MTAEDQAADPEGFGLAEVERAATRIAGRVHRTPVLASRLLDRELGCQVLLKAEHLQRVGAFKARGAFSALLALDPARRAAGVLAVSSGNHGQAVALAAAETGGRAVVVMPAGSNPAKVAATRAYGAEVVTDGVTGENRERFAAELAERRGLHLVHPFDDHDVMAGQGTAALELLAEVPDLDLVLVPVGGGGLIAGTAAAVRTATELVAEEFDADTGRLFAAWLQSNPAASECELCFAQTGLPIVVSRSDDAGPAGPAPAHLLVATCSSSPSATDWEAATGRRRRSRKVRYRSISGQPAE